MVGSGWVGNKVWEDGGGSEVETLGGMRTGSLVVVDFFVGLIGGDIVCLLMLEMCTSFESNW